MGKGQEDQWEVSIHAPREGCDVLLIHRCYISMSFQFTHPGRGATNGWTVDVIKHILFQFTHPGRGATDTHLLKGCTGGVSIHAPREGCDQYQRSPACYRSGFQFTHPGRGAT